MPLQDNPIAKAITEKMTELLSEDMNKRDIREKINETYPNIEPFIFEVCFCEAFASMT